MKTFFKAEAPNESGLTSALHIAPRRACFFGSVTNPVARKDIGMREGRIRHVELEASKGDVALGTLWEKRPVAKLAKLDQACLQLPTQLQTVALKRINEIGRQLAERGFSSEMEVVAESPCEAQVLAWRLKEVHAALILLAANRDRCARGAGAAKTRRLAEAERFASQVLGVETNSHPGLNLAVPAAAESAVSTPTRAKRWWRLRRTERIGDRRNLAGFESREAAY